MSMSVTQAHLAADAAKQAGLQFVPLVDGRIPIDEWRSALTTFAKTNPAQAEVLSATEQLCSPKLIEKDAYAHFPSAFVEQNGQFHPNRLIGAMPVQFWRQGIQERLKASTHPQCIQQNQFIALDPQLAGLDDDQNTALGAYERISPDGRYVLRSFSGKKLSAVTVVELPGPADLSVNKGQHTALISRQKIIQTPLSNEAFPVQGSWRYIVDTNGNHYTFNSIISNKYAGYSQTNPVFSGGMDGFYAAAAEVNSTYPVRDNNAVQIRSLSWPNASGSSVNSSADQGVGMLTSRTISVNTTAHDVIADSGRVNHCLNRLALDGSMYALPMISVDGKEFAALPQNPVSGVPTMRIFGFGSDGKQCEPAGQFTLQSGKVTFGFSSKMKKQADLAYEYRGQVWWVQRHNANKPELPLNLAPWEDPAAQASKTNPNYKDVTASAFPGFTRDGRIIYAATWRRCEGDTERDCRQEGGYVVADPYQSHAYRNELVKSNAKASNNSTKSCITVQEVAKERSDFAAFHRISD